MQERKDVQNKGRILHAVREMPHYFGEYKNLVGMPLFPIFYYLLLILICYIFSKS